MTCDTHLMVRTDILSDMRDSAKPLITVITVCYNAVDQIEATLMSVISQSYDNIEYIVIDGGSTDGTPEVIEKYNVHLSFYVSEPDNGIYHAMNKGIKRATGDYINFLNVGDVFCDSQVVDRVSDFVALNQFDIVYGDMVSRYSFGNRIVHAGPLSKISYDMVFSHQSTFVRADILHQRNFNLEYRLAADYDFLVWAYSNGCTFGYLAIPVASIDAIGGATHDNFVKSRRECFRIQVRNGGNAVLCFLWLLWRVFYFKVITAAKGILPQALLKTVAGHMR